MKYVAYTGTSDYRELGEEDFKKAGVEHKTLSFARGMAVEVSDEVAAVLTSHELFSPGEFSIVEDTGTIPTPEGSEDPEITDDTSGEQKPKSPRGSKSS